MKKSKADSSVLARKVRELWTDIGEYIPLVPQGTKIVIDETKLDGFLIDMSDGSFWDKLLRRRDKTGLSQEQLAQAKETLTQKFNAVAVDIPFDVSELERASSAALQTVVMASPQKLSEGRDIQERMQIFKEWLCIRHALLEAGARLEVLNPAEDEGGLREVYTRDRYVLINGTAYLPDPEHISRFSYDADEYKGEIRQIAKHLQEDGIKTVFVPAWFEGGNVIRHFRSRTIFVGLEGNTQEQDVGELLKAINGTQGDAWTAVPVPLTNVDMYHMDTGMSEELPNGEILLSPLLTDVDTYERICEIVGYENVIQLFDDEADRLATNMISVGDTLVMTGVCDDLRGELAARGYKIVMPDDYGQEDFEFGLGGVHCMTNDVKRTYPQRQAPPPAPV